MNTTSLQNYGLQNINVTVTSIILTYFFCTSIACRIRTQVKGEGGGNVNEAQNSAQYN